MDQDMERQVYLKKYLLGDLDEEERRQIEKRLLIDGDFFSELLVVEDELADDYVTNSLSAREHEQFEDHYLSTPKRVQKLKFARAFRRYILDSPAAAAEPPEGAAAAPPTTVAAVEPAADADHARPAFRLPNFLRPFNSTLGFSLAAALLLAALIGVVVIVIRQNENRTADGTGERAGVGAAADSQSPQNLNSASAQANSPSALLSVTLIPGLVRDTGEIRRVTIPAGTETVQLQLELAADDHQCYRASLQTDEGRELVSSKLRIATTPRGRKIAVMNLSAGLLSRGDYRLRLSGSNAPDDGFEELGTYSFRVPNN